MERPFLRKVNIEASVLKMHLFWVLGSWPHNQQLLLALCMSLIIQSLCNTKTSETVSEPVPTIKESRVPHYRAHVTVCVS
jgi:hypothetical protein